MRVLLKDTCLIIMGQSPDSKSYNNIGEGLPFYQGNADFGDVHPLTRVWCASPIRIAKEGDILISVRAPIGAMNIASTRCCIGRGLAALRSNEGELDNRFLFYALQSMVDQLIEQGTGSTFKAIGKSVLENVELPYYSLAEQAKIVSELNKLGNAIAIKNTQLALLDEVVKSRFIEMFGDCSATTKLSDVAVISGGLTKNSKREKLPLKMPYLRVANVAFGSIDVSEMLNIGLTKDEFNKTLLRDEDLLFVEGNGSPDQIGRVAIWRDEIKPCVHQNHLIKARFNKSIILPVFAMYYFMTLDGRNQIKRKAVSTSGLYTLSVLKVSDLVLPVPSLKLQYEFSSFVEQVDKSKLVIKKNLAELEELKNSLTQKYFFD